MALINKSISKVSVVVAIFDHSKATKEIDHRFDRVMVRNILGQISGHRRISNALTLGFTHRVTGVDSQLLCECNFTLK